MPEPDLLRPRFVRLSPADQISDHCPVDGCEGVLRYEPDWLKSGVIACSESPLFHWRSMTLQEMRNYPACSETTK